VLREVEATLWLALDALVEAESGDLGLIERRSVGIPVNACLGIGQPIL
jgi:hypothetical protein